MIMVLNPFTLDLKSETLVKDNFGNNMAFDSDRWAEHSHWSVNKHRFEQGSIAWSRQQWESGRNDTYSLEYVYNLVPICQ